MAKKKHHHITSTMREPRGIEIEWKVLVRTYSLQLSLLIFSAALLLSSVCIMVSTRCKEGWDRHLFDEGLYHRGCAEPLANVCNGTVSGEAIDHFVTHRRRDAQRMFEESARKHLDYCTRRCRPCFD
jgi:hypothetical protein